MPRIREYHKYHGAALALIAEHEQFSSINKLREFDARSVYVINHDRALYVKHCTADDNAWNFTFAPEHQETIRELFARFPDRVYIVLVCNDEICLLSYGEYAACLDENFRESERLAVWRPDGGGFRVRGAQGQLPHVVPLNRFPDYFLA